MEEKKKEEISDIILELNDTYSISTSLVNLNMMHFKKEFQVIKMDLWLWFTNCDVINIGNNKTTSKIHH